MGRKRVRVNKGGYIYLPKELREEGYNGLLETLPNHFTITIFKPGSTLQQRKESLKLVIRDLDLQMSGETK